MKTFRTILFAAVATAFASPLAIRAQTRNIAPTDAKIQAYRVVQVATADKCRAICESDESCLSFASGLPNDAKKPQCLLYKVTASQIQTRQDEVHNLDKAHPVNPVPSSIPTQDKPWGDVSGGFQVQNQVQPQSKVKTVTRASGAGECQITAMFDSDSQSCLFGLFDKATASICQLFLVGSSLMPGHGDDFYVLENDRLRHRTNVSGAGKDAPRDESFSK